jgi:magnesium transporter
MLPSLVVSAFSMNVHIPLQQNPFAFWIIMGLSLASALVVAAFWKFKRL